MEDERLDKVAKELFDFRVKHNLSQAKFAELANVTMQTVSNVETKKYALTRFTEMKIYRAMKLYEERIIKE